MLPDCSHAAAAYLDRGWSVVPLSALNQSPCLPWSAFRSRLPRREELTTWFATWPDANVGIVTGAVSDLVVVDASDGAARALVESLLPDSLVTPLAETGSRRYYFLRRPSCELRHHVRQSGAALEVRDGGYVVAPPSTLPNGVECRWLVTPEEAAVAEMPPALLELLRAPEMPPPAAGAVATEDEPDGSSGAVSAARQLVAIGERLELFHDERGQGYAVLDGGAVRIKGERLKHHLADALYTRAKLAAGSEALTTACRLLEAKARKGLERRLFNRVALEGQERVWFDLCDRDGRAVCVTPLGWTVVTQPPPVFRRFSHQRRLPAPTTGGSVTDLFRFVNVEDDGERMLVLAWLVAALVEDGPHALLLIHGSQGAAKTTAARMLRSLIDPSEVAASPVPATEGELAQVLDHHYVPIFDNLTRITTRQSDLLCQAATGGAFTKRELFTDDGEVIFTFRRPMILTGINLPTAAPDLLDRAVLLHLERITPERRREESVLWREFDAAVPGILGALLDTLSSAMRVRRRLAVTHLPRMADFTRWGAAAAEVLGFGADRFLTTYLANINQQVEEVLADSPVGRVVLLLVARAPFKGTAAELLDKLEGLADDATRRHVAWPSDAAALGRCLNKLAGPLAEVGIQVTKERAPGGTRERLVTISRGGGTVPPVPAVEQAAKTEQASGNAPEERASSGRPEGVPSRPAEGAPGRPGTAAGRSRERLEGSVSQGFASTGTAGTEHEERAS